MKKESVLNEAITMCIPEIDERPCEAASCVVQERELSRFVDAIIAGVLETLKPALTEEIQKAVSAALKTNREPVTFTTPGLTYKPLYKMEELCELFKVTKPTIYDWIKRGQLKPHKIRSRVYFLWEDVERLINGTIGGLT